jgi:hypothetical protein
MLKRFIITVALLFPLFVFAQETPNVIVGPVSSQQKAAQRVKEKKREQADKAEKQGIKQHYKLQDKATRKRMRHDKREANRVNENKRKGFFMTRWLKKRRS